MAFVERMRQPGLGDGSWRAYQQKIMEKAGKS